MDSAQQAAPSSKPIRFPPSWHAVIFGAALVGLAALVALTKDALAPYIVGLVLVFVMNGLVDRLARFGWPRWAGTLTAIVLLIVFINAFVYVVLDAVIEQFAHLVSSLPEIRDSVIAWLVSLNLPDNVYQALSEWVDGLTAAFPNVLPGVFGFFLSGVASVVAFLFAIVGLPFWIFYALSDSPALLRGLREAVPPAFRESTFTIIGILGEVFGAWARGLLILSLAVGIPFFIGFKLFGILIDPDIGDYALLFAVTLGLAEFVPIVGPIIAVVPILLITAVISGPSGVIAVLILFVIIEQIDGAVLIPRVQGHALNLHPAIILPALVVGSALAGLMGAVLSLPVAASLRRIFAYLIELTSADVPETTEAPDQLEEPEPLAT